MVTFGLLTLVPILSPIRMAAGFGSLTTDGHGFLTSPGAGRLITMVVGFIMAIPGHGGPDRLATLTTPCGLPRTFRSLVLADATVGLDLVLGLVRLVGAQSARMTIIVHGMGGDFKTRSTR